MIMAITDGTDNEDYKVEENRGAEMRWRTCRTSEDIGITT